jgi:hypothetical protein
MSHPMQLAPPTVEWQWGDLRDGGDPAGRPALVVKVGGSLLARDDWPTVLRSLMVVCESGAGLDLARPVTFVVGGGGRVDVIRRLDRAIGLDPDVSHRLAIDAMGSTARLVAEAMGWPLVVSACRGAGPCILDVPRWLDADGRFERLPVGWHVTSDSIAAVVAEEMSSDLLLLKSSPPPRTAGDAVAEAASAGWLDAWFPTAAAKLTRIAWAAPRRPAP